MLQRLIILIVVVNGWRRCGQKRRGCYNGCRRCGIDVEEEESNAGTTGAEDVEDVEDEEAEEGANTPGAGNPFGKFNLCSI